MTKPICVKCQRFYRPKQNGYSFVEGMPDGGNPQPGTVEPERWVPYKLWHADLWECHGCGNELIIGAGHNPTAEHFEPGFADKCKAFDATLQVNDC